MPRPPPRWAKWSRGVRTRGLRVGLVGGPRPLFFLGPGFSYRMKHTGPLTSAGRLTLTFKRSGLIYGTDDEPPGFRLRIKGAASGHKVRSATVGAFQSCTLWHFFALGILKSWLP